MTFISRRIRNSLLIIIASLLITALLNHYGTPLYSIQIMSGWLLTTLLIILQLYSFRKKITLIPIGKTSSWLQFHSYAGLLSVLVFLQHTSFRLPNGVFETILSSLFILTALSGLIGLIFSRVIPKYLTRRGEDVIYEQIPLFTYELRKQAQILVIECTSQTHSTALADYYKNQLDSFFYGQKNIFSHFYGSMNALFSLEIKHNTFCRYLNSEEHVYADQLFDLVRKKYDLDFHFALQGVLKYWLFIHIPLTYILLIAASLHIILVYAFLGPL